MSRIGDIIEGLVDGQLYIITHIGDGTCITSTRLDGACKGVHTMQGYKLIKRGPSKYKRNLPVWW